MAAGWRETRQNGGKKAERARQFLPDTVMFYGWCRFGKGQPIKWSGMEWLHSDCWSAAYDRVHDGRFSGRTIPDDTAACLVAYWESHALHLKEARA